MNKTERLIREKMMDIYEIYKEYNPKGKYLSLTIIDGAIMFNNSPKDDKKKPIDFFERVEEKDNEETN